MLLKIARVLILISTLASLASAGADEASPVDCVLGEWKAWEACNRSCGPGYQKRFRDIPVKAPNRDKECPSNIMETRGCKHRDCPLHCVLDKWTTWSPCEPSCGYGVQSRHRPIAVEARNGDKKCYRRIKMRACKTCECPVTVESELPTTPTTISSSATSTVPPPTSSATTSAIPSATSRATPSAMPTTTTIAPMRKNVIAPTVLTLKGALRRRSEVCQNSHPLIQSIKACVANLMNGTVDLDIMVVGVYSRGETHRCTHIGGMRLRRALGGLENQKLLIEYVLFVSSTAKQNLEEVFSGDGVDLAHKCSDVAADYTVVSAITTTTDLKEKERNFLDTTSVTVAPRERNDWVYVICVVVSLMIVCGAYVGYRCRFQQDTIGLSALQLYDASPTRIVARDSLDMQHKRYDESRARRAHEFLARRTPSKPVNQAAQGNESDSGSIYPIFSDSISDSDSIYSIVSDSSCGRV